MHKEAKKKEIVFKESSDAQNLQSAFGHTSHNMSESFELAQSLGAGEPCSLPPAKNLAKKQRPEIAKVQFPVDFSESFYSRLLPFIPDFLKIKTFRKGTVSVCKIDYSPLSVDDRKAFTTKLVELEESDDSVMSLMFQNNQATLTYGLTQHDLF